MTTLDIDAIFDRAFERLRRQMQAEKDAGLPAGAVPPAPPRPSPVTTMTATAGRCGSARATSASPLSGARA